MEAILTSVLYEQLNQGKKGDGDWKPQAYQAVANELRSQLEISITTENVRNRLRIWKNRYANIMDIRTYSKFEWDEEKKMVVITKDDVKDWLKYCETHPNAKQYQNKVIENWDDLCILVGPDRATGDGAEQIDECMEAMETEEANEGGSCSNAGSGSNKRKRERLADAVTSFAESFKLYVDSKKVLEQRTKLNGDEIYEVVSKVYGIEEHQVLRVVKRFMNGIVEEFEMLKRLPEMKKLDWVLLCLLDCI